MRIWTNDQGLPEGFVNAVQRNSFDGDPERKQLGVTTLAAPPQQVWLRRKGGDYEVDVSDYVDALLGSGVHALISQATNEGLSETRLSLEIDGWEIVGYADNYDPEGSFEEDSFRVTGGILRDYKVTSVYAVRKKSQPDWEAQLNCYAYMLKQNTGANPEALEIMAILKDWKRYEFMRKENQNETDELWPYPPKKIVTIPIRRWEDEEVLEYIRRRLTVHRVALEAGIISPCSAEERWVRDQSWAVKKVGTSRAVKGGVCGSEEEAKALIDQLKAKELSDGKKKKPADYFIEHRPGVSLRCAEYCDVAAICSQAQRLSLTTTKYDGDPFTEEKK